jgi:hypothetical protein
MLRIGLIQQHVQGANFTAAASHTLTAVVAVAALAEMLLRIVHQQTVVGDRPPVVVSDNRLWHGFLQPHWELYHVFRTQIESRMFRRRNRNLGAFDVGPAESRSCRRRSRGSS